MYGIYDDIYDPYGDLYDDGLYKYASVKSLLNKAKTLPRKARNLLRRGYGSARTAFREHPYRTAVPAAGAAGFGAGFAAGRMTARDKSIIRRIINTLESHPYHAAAALAALGIGTAAYGATRKRGEMDYLPKIAAGTIDFDMKMIKSMAEDHGLNPKEVTATLRSLRKSYMAKGMTYYDAHRKAMNEVMDMMGKASKVNPLQAIKLQHANQNAIRAYRGQSQKLIDLSRAHAQTQNELEQTRRALEEERRARAAAEQAYMKEKEGRMRAESMLGQTQGELGQERTMRIEKEKALNQARGPAEKWNKLNRVVGYPVRLAKAHPYRVGLGTAGVTGAGILGRRVVKGVREARRLSRIRKYRTGGAILGGLAGAGIGYSLTHNRKRR